MQPPDQNRRRSAAAAIAIALAAPAEGLRRVVYFDPPGIATVCMGHTGPGLVKGKVYSLAECDAFLTADMRKAVSIVDACVPGLPNNVLAAFSDAVFNMGPTIACNKSASTAARLLAEGKLMDACAQLSRWNLARIGGVLVPLPGLTKRRAEERVLCETP